MRSINFTDWIYRLWRDPHLYTETHTAIAIGRSWRLTVFKVGTLGGAGSKERDSILPTFRSSNIFVDLVNGNVAFQPSWRMGLPFVLRLAACLDKTFSYINTLRSIYRDETTTVLNTLRSIFKNWHAVKFNKLLPQDLIHLINITGVHPKWVMYPCSHASRQKIINRNNKTEAKRTWSMNLSLL
jgi:hypothetical protein